MDQESHDLLNEMEAMGLDPSMSSNNQRRKLAAEKGRTVSTTKFKPLSKIFTTPSATGQAKKETPIKLPKTITPPPKTKIKAVFQTNDYGDSLNLWQKLLEPISSKDLEDYKKEYQGAYQLHFNLIFQASS